MRQRLNVPTTVLPPEACRSTGSPNVILKGHREPQKAKIPQSQARTRGDLSPRKKVNQGHWPPRSLGTGNGSLGPALVREEAGGRRPTAAILSCGIPCQGSPRWDVPGQKTRAPSARKESHP